MNDVFRPFLRKFVLVFFDDILIYSASWATHLDHLRVVFHTLQINSLVAKQSKCSFGLTKISYLGHFISNKGIEVDPSKIDTIQLWPRPTSVKQVRGFLGLTGYYRRFIRNYAAIAGPLTDLLKKEAFLWTPSAEAAFIKLKQLLSSTPILKLPDFEKPFLLETDASGSGIGAILSQDNQPIAFFNQKLSPRMQQASAYQREMYAITQAVAKWRQYLLGCKFQVITDQQSLRNLKDQVIQTPDQHKWLEKLLGYDFDVIYRPGKHNGAADAISRVHSPAFLALYSQELSFLSELKSAISTDSALAPLIQQLHLAPADFPHYTFRDGLLFCHHRLVIPEVQSIRHQLLHEFHATPIGGHSGVNRTFHRLATNFYWKCMRADVHTFVTQCQVCQQMKSSCVSPGGLLQPLPIPDLVFESLAMDFITALPPSHGKTVIMVVVDRLSKYGHFIALPSSFTSSTVASIFVSEIIRLHGVPLNIVSDRDPRFMSDLWKELHRLQGTTLSFSTAYHPQTDGQTEALNKCLEMYLRCFVTDQPKEWVRFLPWAEFWYNTSFQTAAKMTPFEILYGRKPPSVSRFVKDSTGNSIIAAQLIERDAILQLLKTNLLKAQDRRTLAANKHRRDVQFQVGDWVYVKLQPFRQNSVRLQRHYKLGRRYFGPYQAVAELQEGQGGQLTLRPAKFSVY
ncbi:putative nucleotidyltransferase, Ribonuclease H [Helianthus annuus]|uniref:Nucleotidyltransferase, Ribonuclease H n=1 Tax=Helianthus annuus TaxID=4232 RepID=A0A9K3DXN9_HELAN|nr:putative nucleotidyltransferase, Ribonuclease H [Helianthus annuus]